MKIYDLVVSTFEEEGGTPVVTHVFHGSSPDQAKAFYRAHLKSDAFLRKCSKEGGQRFGNFTCHNKVVGMFEREAGRSLNIPGSGQW